MKMKYRFLLFMLIVVLVSACGGAQTVADTAELVDTTEAETADTGEETEELNVLTIGALWLDASEFYTGVKAGIEEGAANADVEVNLLGNNSQGDAAVEAEQMQTLIGANVDAIIVSAVSEDSSLALIKEAHEADIPVICYNTCISEEDAEEYVYAWVTGDHRQQGGGVGKAAGEYFVEEGIENPKIAVVSCERYAACQERIAGFTEELLKLVPGAEIVDNQEALEVDKAVEVSTNMLTANPDIDAFYGEAGNMVAGAAIAIEQAGLEGNVVIFGHDITPTTAELLIDGTVVKYINAMIAEDFGRTTVDLALSAINGEPSPGVIYNMDPTDFYSSNPEEVADWMESQGLEVPEYEQVPELDSETSETDEDVSQELTIGALWLDASEFYTGVKAGIEEGAANADVEVNLLGNNSQGDAAVEAEQMQTLIGANVDAIIVSAVSEDSSLALIKEAHEADIPVICYNTCISEEDAEEYVYAWVTGDHRQQGGGVGKAAGEYFVEEGIENPKIAVVSCERYAACQERIAGFTEELLKLVPGAEIVDNQEALEVDKAVEVSTNMLTANPDIDAFYGEAGNMVAGAAVAIEQAGLEGNVVIFGHDITPTTAELLIDGTVVKYINAMIAEDFGRTTMDLALSAINGEPSPGVIYNMDPTDFYSSNPEEVQEWLDAHK
jgi:simple sugar transport system substrate-binding protein